MQRVVPVVAVVALLTYAAGARAVAPEIKDEGKFFSPDVVKKANESIRQLARRTGLDLLIETMNSPPGESADKLKAMAPMERDRFYGRLAKERADNVAVRGIYILITHEPARLEIEYRRCPTRFSREDRSQLKSMLIRDFRAKKFDEGLQNAVKFVADKLTPADGNDKVTRPMGE
jgi:hypothetical protein